MLNMGVNLSNFQLIMHLTKECLVSSTVFFIAAIADVYSSSMIDTHVPCPLLNQFGLLP